MKKINFKNILIFIIKIYKYFVSPYLGNNCRFYPTCSSYAIEAIEKHGVFVGIKLSMLRILKCNPWGGSGVDHVREKDAKN